MLCDPAGAYNRHASICGRICAPPAATRVLHRAPLTINSTKMNKSFIVFMALVAFTAAIPVNPQIPEGEPQKQAVICARDTPCAWVIWDGRKDRYNNEDLEQVPNSYCVCDTGMSCTFAEDDVNTASAVFKCRPAS